MNVVAKPLFRVRLLKLGDEEHILVMALEHIVTDGRSMSLLLRDILGGYAQLLQGEPITLPYMPVQFADYAVWQRKTERAWVAKHMEYWHERMKSFERLRFPFEPCSANQTARGWGFARFMIGKELKVDLQQCCQSRRTTMVMGAFTAYVALVLRWCGVQTGVVLFQSDGRRCVEVENCVGYFAYPLYVCVELREDDCFADLLPRVIEEYCRAYEHGDASYMEAQNPRPPFTRNTCFNWVPEAVTIEGADGAPCMQGLTYTRVPFKDQALDNYERDTEPMLGLIEAGGEIRGSLVFPQDRTSRAAMDRFAANFLAFLRAFIDDPRGRIRDIPLS